jgi:flagellar hook-associated protein 3
MSFTSRLSSFQRFSNIKSNVLNNQLALAEDTGKLNTGKRVLNNYDDPSITRSVTQLNGLLFKREQSSINKGIASSEFDLAESSLASMKNILDQIRSDAVQGGSDTLDSNDRTSLSAQLRSLGETLFKLANSKIGSKYIFSGKQSDLKTVDYVPEDVFGNAVYKEGQSDLGERSVEGIQSNVSLASVFTGASLPASVTGTVNNPVATGKIALSINDGTGNIINTGDITFAGDNIAAIVAKINAAFTAAGGTGAIAQESPVGYLKLNTSLVTNSLNNSESSIMISPGSVPGTALSNLGLMAGTTIGHSANLQETLDKLESAYNSDNSQGIRNAIIDLDSNINRLIDAQSQLGDLSKRFKDSVGVDNDRISELKMSRSDLEDIPVVEAISDVTRSQAVVSASLQVSSAMLKQTVFDFIGF